ncbi:6400_t:CDS:2, partial [Gigaspora rosea]
QEEVDRRIPIWKLPYVPSREAADTELDHKTRSHKGPEKARQALIKKQNQNQYIKSTYKTFLKHTKTHTKAVDQDQLQVQEPVLKMKALSKKGDILGSTSKRVQDKTLATMEN